MNATLNDLKAKYEEMAQRLDRGRLTIEDLLIDENLPFTQRVLKVALPEKFKVPRLKLYDETTDSIGTLGV